MLIMRSCTNYQYLKVDCASWEIAALDMLDVGSRLVPFPGNYVSQGAVIVTRFQRLPVSSETAALDMLDVCHDRLVSQLQCVTSGGCNRCQYLDSISSKRSATLLDISATPILPAVEVLEPSFASLLRAGGH